MCFVFRCNGTIRAENTRLTLLHHADVDAALEATGLAVSAVVFGDGAAAVKGTSETGLPLHTAPEQSKNTGSRHTIIQYDVIYIQHNQTRHK